MQILDGGPYVEEAFRAEGIRNYDATSEQMEFPTQLLKIAFSLISVFCTYLKEIQLNDKFFNFLTTERQFILMFSVCLCAYYDMIFTGYFQHSTNNSSIDSLLLVIRYYLSQDYQK